MALTQERTKQIQDALRSLQGRVKDEPNLQGEIDSLKAKLAEGSESATAQKTATLAASTSSTEIAPEDGFQGSVSAGIQEEIDADGNVISHTEEGDVELLQSQSAGRRKAKAAARARKIKALETQVETEQNLRTGSEINIGAELETFRKENTAFRSLLSEKLGLAGFDEQLKEFEDQANLLVDRDDEANQKQFTDLANARKTGILDEAEYQAKLKSIVDANGLAPEFLSTLPTEDTPEADFAQDAAPVEGEVPLLPEIEVKGENVVENTTTDVSTYANPDTGVTYEDNPDSGTVDLTKLTLDDLLALDGSQLLQAEFKLALGSNAADDAIDDAFFKDILSLMKTTEESSRLFTQNVLTTQVEDAAIKQQEAEDELFFAEQQLEINKAEAFEDIASAQAKSEGYMRGKMSAYGATSSTSALAIHSSNHLKFAKIKANASNKFDAEANRLERLSITTQRAYTNTIVNINLQASKDLTDLASSTQGNLLNLMNQKLKSDSQKDKERLQLQLGYVKGIKGIEAGKIQAEADAQKEARAFAKDQMQMAKWMGDQTGTIWRFDGSGQMFDSGDDNIDTTVAKEKLKIAWAKLSKSGSGGSGGAGKDSVTADFIINHIRTAREANRTEQDIANDLVAGGPLIKTSESDMGRFAQEYRQSTAVGEGGGVRNIPYLETLNSIFGFNVPSSFEVPETPAEFVVGQKSPDKIDKVLKNQGEIDVELAKIAEAFEAEK